MTNGPVVSEVSQEAYGLRCRANNVGHYLCGYYASGVDGVELYGSVARGTATLESDIDMIVLADGFLAATWILRVKELHQQHGDTQPIKAYRYKAAIELFRFDEDILASLMEGNPQALDLSIFPPNWNSLKKEMIKMWPRWNMRFLSEIQKEAVRFVPYSGFRYPDAPLPDPIGPRDYPSNNY